MQADFDGISAGGIARVVGSATSSTTSGVDPTTRPTFEPRATPAVGESDSYDQAGLHLVVRINVFEFVPLPGDGARYGVDADGQLRCTRTGASLTPICQLLKDPLPKSMQFTPKDNSSQCNRSDLSPPPLQPKRKVQAQRAVSFSAPPLKGPAICSDTDPTPSTPLKTRNTQKAPSPSTLAPQLLNIAPLAPTPCPVHSHDDALSFILETEDSLISTQITSRKCKFIAHCNPPQHLPEAVQRGRSPPPSSG